MKRLIFASLLALLALCSLHAAAPIASESAWCWFADPRALHFETPDGRINCTYVGYIDTHGNVRATQFDFNNETQTEVLVRSYFQPDDHNNPTFLALPDGRIMIFYSRHTDEPCFYYRISAEPGDITTLGAEQRLETANNTTYPSPFILEDDPDHIYLCWRGINWHPTIARLTMPDANDRVEFVGGPWQIVQSTGARPYAKYHSDGKNKISLAYTTGHPDNEMPNYLYYNEIDIRDMSLRDVEGHKLSSIADGPFRVSKSPEYRQQYPATIVDAGNQRDWLWQLEEDRNGNPVIAMTRISDDKRHHNYLVATHRDGQWKTNRIAYGGGHFHQTPNIEKCYSGGMALDPDNVNVVYCSQPVEGKHGKVYELFKYTLDGDGEIVGQTQVTRDSEKGNARPFVIKGTAESPLKLGWMQGDYYDWIVSKERPLGYPTQIMTDFDSFESIPYGTHASRRQAAAKPAALNLQEDFLFTETVSPKADKGIETLLTLGNLSYRIDHATLCPEVRLGKKTWKSGNKLANADAWKDNGRGTGGQWYTPVPYESFDLTLDYHDGMLSVYVNGMLDQKMRLAPSRKTPMVFTLKNPDYTLSPLTGMTRKHWTEAGEYILGGAFSNLASIDDPMYFKRQLDKTYPRNNGGIGVAKLEGLARTFFLAAPLLRDNPDLTLNGIKVADYYRKHIKDMTVAGTTDYIPHRTGGPSQTLLELGSICLSLKAAPDAVWNTFSKAEKDSLASLFLSYGEGPTIGSNWQFFNVFILSFLKDQGYTVNEEYLQQNLRNLLDRYRGEGWYNDAPAYDYYSMWAFQTYGPLWAEMFGKEQYPEIAAQFLKNQGDLVDNYPYMFSRDGKMNMWGRSLPYRFASVSPLPLVEYGGHDGVNYGWLRRIASATLLQFLQDPGFLEDGIPTMGYFGPFAPCVQIYSCRGSVYWIGKAFFSLLLPEDSQYWTAVENNGPWDKDLLPGQAYNKFQPATNLMITDYPNCGGSEMRSWCHETVAGDWQKFRSSENYNKLAYHTEFPWMADGKHGEVSMNYATRNARGDWEVLRLYDFQSFDHGAYRRDAVLESDPEVRFQLTDIPVADGVLRIDRVTTPRPMTVRLGSYSLAEGTGLVSGSAKPKNGSCTAGLLGNGEWQLANIPLQGWQSQKTLTPVGLHPVSYRCGLQMNEAEVDGSQVLVTLQLWKKGKKGFTDKELSQVSSVDVSADGKDVKVRLSDGTLHHVTFE